jgi:Flp pilus assembly pilin Flp
VEYALILVLIAIAVIVALGLLSGQIQNVFTRITGSLGG